MLGQCRIEKKNMKLNLAIYGAIKVKLSKHAIQSVAQLYGYIDSPHGLSNLCSLIVAL